MGYKISKSFKEEGVERVTITATKESKGFWDSETKKTFEVVKKEKIYEMIAKEKRISLHRKYIKGFSLKEYREEYGLGEKENIDIEKIFITNSFFESNEKGEIDFSCIDCENDISIGTTVFGLDNNCEHGKFDFSWLKAKNGEVGFHIIFDDADVIFECCEFGKKNVYFTHSIFGEGNVYFSESDFGDGDCYFDDVDFGDGDVYFLGPVPQLVREPVRFGKGKVSFKNANFGKGVVDFRAVIFGEGEVSFEQTFFGDGNVSFAVAKFGNSKVRFNSTFGEGKISFEGAIFGDSEVSFQHTSFGNGDISFFRTVFGKGNLNFKEISLSKGEINFDSVEFKGKEILFSFARLDKCTLNLRDIKTNPGKFSILDVTCNKIDFGGATLYGDLDSRVKRVNQLSFQDAILYANIDFGDHVHSGKVLTPNIKEVNFINTKLYGKIHLDYTKFGLKQAIENQKIGKEKVNTTHKQKADQYRLFKENFRNLGQYDDEDEAYVQFRKHWLRDQAGWDKAKSIREVMKKHPFYLFKLYLFEKIGLYGTSPVQVIKNMGLCIALFSLPYWVLGNTEPLYLPEKMPVWMIKLFNGTYHSIITFLTIGYGDKYVYPSFWGRVFSGIEGFAGLFLMAYFTIAFVRKVLR